MVLLTVTAAAVLVVVVACGSLQQFNPVSQRDINNGAGKIHGLSLQTVIRASPLPIHLLHGEPIRQKKCFILSWLFRLIKYVYPLHRGYQREYVALMLRLLVGRRKLLSLHSFFFFFVDFLSLSIFEEPKHLDYTSIFVECTTLNDVGYIDSVAFIDKKNSSSPIWVNKFHFLRNYFWEITFYTHVRMLQ